LCGKKEKTVKKGILGLFWGEDPKDFFIHGDGGFYRDVFHFKDGLRGNKDLTSKQGNIID